MSWRAEGGMAAARQSPDVIMTPSSGSAIMTMRREKKRSLSIGGNQTFESQDL